MQVNMVCKFVRPNIIIGYKKVWRTVTYIHYDHFIIVWLLNHSGVLASGEVRGVDAAGKHLHLIQPVHFMPEISEVAESGVDDSLLLLRFSPLMRSEPWSGSGATLICTAPLWTSSSCPLSSEISNAQPCCCIIPLEELILPGMQMPVRSKDHDWKH